MAHVPVVDLAGQALLHQAADLGDAGGDQVPGAGEFFGHAFGDGPVERDVLHAGGQPGRVAEGQSHGPFGIIQGFVVQVPCLAGGPHPERALRIHLDEAELLGDGAGRVVAVGDLVGDRDEQPRLGAGVVPVGEHRALLEQRAVPLDDQVGHRVEQRVAGGEQVGPRLALGAGQLLVERHPLVLGAAPGRRWCRSGGRGRGCRRGRAGSRSGRTRVRTSGRRVP